MNDIKNLIQQRINLISKISPISKLDNELLLNYADIFEKTTILEIDIFLSKLYIYRSSQKREIEFKKHKKTNLKKGKPELIQQATKYAKKLQEILSYNGIIAYEAVELYENLYDLLDTPNKYFISCEKANKTDLKNFFKNSSSFIGKSNLIKNYIDSLDF